MSDWGATGGRRIADAGRIRKIGERVYRTDISVGRRVDLVDLHVDHRTFRCVRVLDLEESSEPEEFGQAIISVESGRTLAYWQYRPAQYDADSDRWFSEHPGVGLTIDAVPYQRRNCTGRDDVALTQCALSG